jgi:hypothetical protein
MNNKTKVKVLIPVYKNEMNSYEEKALERCCMIFSAYPLVFVKPQSLDIAGLKKRYPLIAEENFAGSYFESITGYNRLMTSPEFYERFADCEYILIYQLDAFAFRDELKQWCDKGYDYIGAPWLLKPKYYAFHMKLFLRIKAIGYYFRGKPFRKLIVGDKIGNGGFSLRKVSSHYDATVKKKDKIAYYLKRSEVYSEFNEDVFWGTQNPEFNYPTLDEALTFSIDEYPELCFRLNHNKIPFGCHGWFKAERISFWENIINNSGYGINNK